MIDRWEPEPPGLLVFAPAWGAIASVASPSWSTAHPPDGRARRSSTCRSPNCAPDSRPGADRGRGGEGARRPDPVRGPARRWFDGPVDGIVYGGLIGAGFAFTENIQYFAVRRGSRADPAAGERDVLRPRHPLALRARDVHGGHRFRTRARGAPGAVVRRSASGRGSPDSRAPSSCTGCGTARPCSVTSSPSTRRCRFPSSSCSSPAAS